MTSPLRRLFPYLTDCILINLSAVLSYYLRYGKNMPFHQLEVYAGMAIVVMMVKIAVYHFMGLYKPMWRYAGFDEILSIFFAVCIGNGIIIVYIYLNGLTMVPRSIYVIATFVDFLFIGGSRFYRKILSRLNLTRRFSVGSVTKRAMIIGAGEAGGMLIQEYRNNPARGIVPVCLIDDDRHKIGRGINGIPVVGDRHSIAYFAEAKRIDQLIIAIPSIKRNDLTSILEECNKTKCQLKILPFFNQIQDIAGNVSEILLKKMRSVDIDDLLGREEVDLDNSAAYGLTEGKTVLVTGGGGSIGSELCRQISRLNPARIVITEISEEHTLYIADELSETFPSIAVERVIMNIREEERVREVFDLCRPDIVFHTAAHKHVHLMELNPREAVKNNVLGTWNVVRAADATGVKRFVLVSTDKAVNPTNVYGATKRVCEMIVQAVNANSRTEFTAVRFGNVLGSNGSVIPIFKKQIAAGGPVTVRHPEVIRYFMTVQEASKLVILAGAMAKGGEIFVLDMGKPVKMDKLARDLVRLSGLTPDEDIEIRYTGLKPGEKLYEELLMADENLVSTENSKIFISRIMDISMEDLEDKLHILRDGLAQGDAETVTALRQVVPTYRPTS